MSTPFPGMDPYLEDPVVWPDFHTTFLVALRAELNKVLPPGYVARLDRHVWIDEPELENPKMLGGPDVFVTEEFQTVDVAASPRVLSGPVTATLPLVNPKGKTFVKVLDLAHKRVVTVLELLSPANKSAGKDRDAYLAKRLEYFRSGMNVVELDLLRGGRRPPVDGPLPPADYYVMVSPAAEYPRATIWPFGVQDPLPTVPVPVGASIEPTPLQLRPALDRSFEEGRFGEELQYDQPLVPPLKEADRAWVREVLATRQSTR